MSLPTTTPTTATTTTATTTNNNNKAGTTTTTTTTTKTMITAAADNAADLAHSIGCCFWVLFLTLHITLSLDMATRAKNFYLIFSVGWMSMMAIIILTGFLVRVSFDYTAALGRQQQEERIMSCYVETENPTKNHNNKNNNDMDINMDQSKKYWMYMVAHQFLCGACLSSLLACVLFCIVFQMDLWLMVFVLLPLTMAVSSDRVKKGIIQKVIMTSEDQEEEQQQQSNNNNTDDIEAAANKEKEELKVPLLAKTV